MSFILDALKKSEAERQRQSGPTLLEVRITPPRRRYPLWALIVGALLLINAVVLLIFMLRRPSVAGVDSAAPAAAAAPAPVPMPVPVPAAVGAAPALPLPPAPAPAPAAAKTDLADAEQDQGNPADQAPAVAPDPGQKASRPAASTYDALPSSSDISNLPELRLDLHVYAERAGDRYALINMHRVHEGDVVPEGARVLAITREGVAMDYHGQDFMLRPQ